MEVLHFLDSDIPWFCASEMQSSFLKNGTYKLEANVIVLSKQYLFIYFYSSSACHFYSQNHSMIQSFKDEQTETWCVCAGQWRKSRKSRWEELEWITEREEK